MDIPLSESDLIKILNAEDLYGIMQRVLLRENKIDRGREHFWVVGLEINNRLLFVELISLGSATKTIAEPMEVFSLALQKRAARIILVHNHPSGEMYPSENDKDITDRLIQVGIIVRTEVADHLIICERTFMSFSEEGLMAELRKSIKYVPPYVLKKRYEEEALLLVQKREIAIAKRLIEKKMSIKDIADATGLSEEVIKGIKLN